MRRSSANDEAADGGLAFQAGLVFAVIDAVDLLEFAGGSVGIDIIAKVPPRCSMMRVRTFLMALEKARI